MSDDHRWIEQELADLPQQPMPDSVRARLDSAITAAATPIVPRQQGDPTAEPVPATTAPRPRHRWLLAAGGVAAALALVMAVDPFLLRDQGSETFDTATEPIAEESGEAATAGEAADSDTVASTSAVPPISDDTEMLLASGTTYNRQQLEGQTQQTLRERASASRQPPSAAAATGDDPATAAAPTPTPSVDPMACAAALPGEGELQFVDQAGFEGEEALVTARLADGVLEVFVQDPTCTAEDPAVRYRATVGAPGQPDSE